MFETPFPISKEFDVSPDGRFLVIQIEEQHPRQIEVNLNWFEELKERVPVP